MSDLRERIRHDEHALQKLMDKIPGFKGYHEQEIRRGADKLVRDHLATLLDQVRQRLFRFQGELSKRGDFKPVTDLDRLTRRLVRAKDRLEHAPYGYAGFFDAPRIGVKELDRLYDYDLSLRDGLAKIEEAATAVIGAEKQQFEEKLRALDEQVEEFSRMIDRRSEVASELTP